MMTKENIVQYWNKTGLLEDFRPIEKEKVAQLLENQKMLESENPFFDTSAGRILTNVLYVAVHRVLKELLRLECSHVRIVPMRYPTDAIEGTGKELTAVTKGYNYVLPEMALKELEACYRPGIEKALCDILVEKLLLDIKEEIKQDTKKLGDDEILYYCPYVLIIPKRPFSAGSDSWRFFRQCGRKVIKMSTPVIEGGISKRTALVLGFTGQTGSHLVDLLIEKDYRVVGLRRRTSTFNTKRVEHLYTHPDFIQEWGNITDSFSLWRLLKKYQPDEIYNMAAQSHVRVSFDVPEETLDVVAGGTLKLLNAYKELCPNAKFYQANSSEMFGDNPEHPQNEETKLLPASPYACSKVFAHNICRNYRESYGLHISCGILFNHEGPRRGETFVTRKITQAAARIKLGLQQELLLGNLDAKRDWGYAIDFVEGIWLMLQQDKPDDYVLATGETHSVKEFLNEVFTMADLDPQKFVKIDERLFRPHEVPLLLGDASKAKRVLDWQAKVKFKELAKLMYIADLKEQAKIHHIPLANGLYPGTELNHFKDTLNDFTIK